MRSHYALARNIGFALLPLLATFESAIAEQERAALPVALQMYTLREFGTLEEKLALAASTGYRAIEIVGTQGVTSTELIDLLDEHSLQVISAHVDIGTLRSRLDEVIAFQRSIGNDTVVMPFLSRSDRPTDADGWRALGSELGSIGQRLREAGITLAYHNHDFEMVAFDGETALDLLLGAARPENLGWQADVAWVSRGGHDPAEMLNRYSGRVVSIHAKDNAPEGENANESGFADVGHGVLDWERILPAAKAAGASWFIVEHDDPLDEERSIRRSLEFLEGR